MIDHSGNVNPGSLPLHVAAKPARQVGRCNHCLDVRGKNQTKPVQSNKLVTGWGRKSAIPWPVSLGTGFVN